MPLAGRLLEYQSNAEWTPWSSVCTIMDLVQC
jgi:hypothetical protein